MREGARGHLRRIATTATAWPGRSRSGTRPSLGLRQLEPTHLAEQRLETPDGCESVRALTPGRTSGYPTWRIRRVSHHAVIDELSVI